MKKISIFALIIIFLFGAAYFSGVDLSFLGLRSAILGDDCTSSELLANKAEYDKSVTEITALNSYITLNTCATGGQINTLGKNNFEIAACQRKLILLNNKQTFVSGYNACQASVDAGPRVLTGSVLTDSGGTSRALIEQDTNEDMHLNESVYSLTLRSQGEAYIKELSYEMAISATNGNPDVNVTKAELSSSRTGVYACSQNLAATQTDTSKKIYTITCRAVGNGYLTMVDGVSDNFDIKLNLSVSTVVATGQGTLRFVGGKFSTTPTGAERDLTRISVTPGVLSYTMAYVDPRDLTVSLVAQTDTSSTTIPVRVVFNKLINTASVSLSDFVITGDVSATNLQCSNTTDNDDTLRTICTFDLEVNNIADATAITVDLPAGTVQDKTRITPKNNSAAAQIAISYVFGAPKIFVGAPCSTESAFCSGLDNTPQLIVYAHLGKITEGSLVSIYANDNCSGTPVDEVTATRDIPKIDLYEKVSLQKDETKYYSAQIGSSCSSLGSTAAKKAGYQYTGETIAQVDRLVCMNSATFKTQGFSKFSVGPYVANTRTLCDPDDTVDPITLKPIAEKCNAWQGNATFNPECFPTGQGTLNNPYRVCSPEQLQEMDNLPLIENVYYTHFRLGKNIDLTPTSNWFGGKGFQPIGRTMHFGFFGSLDGNGYEIQNLTFNNPDDNIGLFGQAQGASLPGVWINNLKLNNVTIQNPGVGAGSLAGMMGCAIISGVDATGVNITSAQNMTGGLIGYTGYETKVLYSKVNGGSSGIITSDNMLPAPQGSGAIGGLIGRVPGSLLEVRRVETNINLSAKGNGIGGLIGHLYGSEANKLKISEVTARGKITAKTGSAAVGGVLGDAQYVRVENSSALPATSSTKILAEGTGTVGSIGGFVGAASYSEFIGNTSKYPIQGHTGGTIGGFGGRVDASTVEKNSSTGAIGGENSKGPRGLYVAGFVGFSSGGTFTDNYTTSDVFTSQGGPASYVGGFSGMAGGTVFKRNYAKNTIRLNHAGDYTVGGFVAYIAESSGLPYILSDNFSSVSFVDNGGLYQSNVDNLGGFIGFTYKKPTDTVENNYYFSTQPACTSTASPDKPACSSVTAESVFQGSAHAVYKRSGNEWDFIGTWFGQNGSLPTHKGNATVGI